MAERKTVNKYYPPDWSPSKGGINKFRGTHPLRERARKLNQGILIIRFEMPYNIWCDGCNNHIGMGVRYNAEKSKIGKYYTTPVYKFRMKCHLCDNHFEMKTDPQNLDYVIITGARRQEGRWDPTENEQISQDKDVSKKLLADPMFRLEHGVEDKQKQKEAQPHIEDLEILQTRWRDDYYANQTLRKKFRTEKKVADETNKADQLLLKKSSLNLKLLPDNGNDRKIASLMKLESVENSESRRERVRNEIISQSIFESKPVLESNQLKKIAKSVINKKVELAGMTQNKLLDIIVTPKSPKRASLVPDYSSDSN